MKSQDISLKGRVAIVTGGGQGIGKAISLSFAKSGAAVCIADIDRDHGEEVSKWIKDLGSESKALRVNVTISEEVSKMVQEVLNEYGRIDILVNNAGGATGSNFNIGRILKITEKDWDETIALNLKSVFLCSRAVAPSMIKQRQGCIINMASITGYIPWPGLPAYSASKAAVINLTKSLAIELAPFVRVNAIAPGLIETPRTSKNRRPEQLKQLLTNVLLGRMGKPEEVADVALFLASDAASWITGTVIEIHGGQIWIAENGRPIFRDSNLYRE